MNTYSAAFTQAVQRIKVPVMGTELAAPLLDLLVRFTRPRRVLEVGMGYTTPFLAASLAGLRDQVRRESSALANKTHARTAVAKPVDDEWLREEPALLAPDFYLQDYEPRMVAIDDLSVPESSAPDVRAVLMELGIDDLVTIVNSDLRDAKTKLPAWLMPIDLAWVDAWECLYFFEEFWDVINPAGGLVVMHYLMTYPEGEAVIDYIKQMEKLRPGELEIVNLLEPHKVTQNSLTMIRRTTAGKPQSYAQPGGGFRWSDVIGPAAERHRTRHQRFR